MSLVFKSVAELYSVPDRDRPYCVEGLFPRGGLNAIAGKPKSGKSTLARQLAVAVSTGGQFLGRPTVQSTVIYLALEEFDERVKKQFQAMGLAEDNNNLKVLCGMTKSKETAIADLEEAIVSIGHVGLVIIDPLMKFVSIKDLNDYQQVSPALEPLIDLSHRTDTCILGLFHSKKAVNEDALDNALGSTAIVAACETFALLARNPSSGQRTIETRQRSGTDLEKTFLNFDAERQWTEIGPTSAEHSEEMAHATELRIKKDLHQFVIANPNSTREVIEAAVTGKTGPKKRMFSELVSEAKIVVSGEGTKGSPYTYRGDHAPLFALNEKICA